MPLFVIEQTSKDRLISDARRGGHNESVKEIETIYVPSVDFIPETLRDAAIRIAASPWGVGGERDPGSRYSPEPQPHNGSPSGRSQ
jgi:hypothetical protein